MKIEYPHKGDAAVASAATLYSARMCGSRERYGMAYETRDEKRRIKSTIKLSSLSSILQSLLQISAARSAYSEFVELTPPAAELSPATVRFKATAVCLIKAVQTNCPCTPQGSDLGKKTQESLLSSRFNA